MFTALRAALSAPPPASTPPRWVYVPYDQLTTEIGPAAAGPAEVGLVLVENPAKAARRPYHRQKLALLLASQRHFAVEAREKGYAVRIFVGGSRDRDLGDGISEVPSSGSTGDILAAVVRVLGPLTVMTPAERELRKELRALREDGSLRYVPHVGWLSTAEDFDAIPEPWRMDAFYRGLRRRTGILMEKGKPVGGKFSFDAENRKSWRGDPPAPTPPRFEVDAITAEVGALIERQYAHHPGRLDLGAIPASSADVERLWNFALTECLPRFGPYEDAMTVRSSTLFHSRISAVLNLHRVLPARVVQDALEAPLPLASKEGFVRQILGWREFVRHVHERTDGFRDQAPVADLAGNGDWPASSKESDHVDARRGYGGALPSALGAVAPLPPAYWGAESGLACLDRVVRDVWDEGWSHHITRLMVLSNLSTLLGSSPRALTDWFWIAYIDAYDWVVEPNVLGMGTYAVGDRMTTKPYVSGAAYINKMSDYCRHCAFDPKSTCPVTPLYWRFLDQHRETLASNPRLAIPLASARDRAPETKARDRAIFETVTHGLSRGQRLRPDDFAAPLPLDVGESSDA